MPVFLLPCMSALQENLSRRQILRRGLAATGALALAGAAYEVLSAVEFPPTIDSATGIETYEFDVHGQAIDSSNFYKLVEQFEAINNQRPDNISEGIVIMSKQNRDALIGRGYNIPALVKSWETTYHNRKIASGLAATGSQPLTLIRRIAFTDVAAPEPNQPEIYTNTSHPLRGPKNFEGFLVIGQSRLSISDGRADTKLNQVMAAIAEGIDRYPALTKENSLTFETDFYASMVGFFKLNGINYSKNPIHASSMLASPANTGFSPYEKSISDNEDGDSHTDVRKFRSTYHENGSIRTIRWRPKFIATSGDVNDLDPSFITRIEYRVAKADGAEGNRFANTADLITTSLVMDLNALQPTDSFGRRVAISGGDIRIYTTNGQMFEGVWGFEETTYRSRTDKNGNQEPTDVTWDLNLLRGNDTATSVNGNPINPYEYIFGRGTRVINSTRTIATPTPTITPTLTITATESPTPTPSPSPSRTRTPSPSPSASPSRTATPTQTSTATQEPGVPTNTPRPETPSPEPATATPGPGEPSTATPVEGSGYGRHLKFPRLVQNSGDW